MRAGRCYIVAGANWTPPFPPACELRGPDAGSPQAAASLISANGTTATMGNKAAHVMVRGRVRLMGVRLEAARLVASAAELDICAGWQVADLGGGLHVTKDFQIEAGSNISLAHAGSTKAGGGVYVGAALNLTMRSSLCIAGTNSSQDGGGLNASAVYLSGMSQLQLMNTSAGINGGGLRADSLTVSGGSQVIISGSQSLKGRGGGFHLDSNLRVSGRSTVVIGHSAALYDGGGFYTIGWAEVTDASVVDVRDASALSCGGFNAEGNVSVDLNSSLLITRCSASQYWGGGFCSHGDVVISNNSLLRISNTSSHINAGALISWVGGLHVSGNSSAAFADILTHAGIAGYLEQDLVVQDRSLVNFSGGACRADTVDLDGGSRLELEFSSAGDVLDVSRWTRLSGASILQLAGTAGEALKSPVLHVTGGSTLALEGFRGTQALNIGQPPESGMDGEVQWLVQQYGAFFVEDGSVVAATDSHGSNALIGVDTGIAGGVNISNVQTRECDGPLIQVTGGGTVAVANVSVLVNSSCLIGDSCEVGVFASPAAARFDNFTVLCPYWAGGCELWYGACSAEGASCFTGPGAPRLQLLAISNSAQSSCPHVAAAEHTNRSSYCSCVNAHAPNPGPLLQKGRSADYCTPCLPNYYDAGSPSDAGGQLCVACPWYAAWSDGGLQSCRPWPGASHGAAFFGLFGPAALLVALVLCLWIVLSSPLHITDMTWRPNVELTVSHPAAMAVAPSKSSGRDDDAAGKAGLVLSVQGPLVGLGIVSRFAWRFLWYRVEGSGAYGVDFQAGKQNVFRLEPRGGRNVRLLGPGADLNRASSQGRLHPVGWRRMLAGCVPPLAVVVLAPTWCLEVQFADDQHRWGHVGMTFLYMIFFWAVAACLLGPLLKNRLNARYARTPLAMLHQSYRRVIQCEPYEGPDPEHPHPQYAGLTAGVLSDTLDHYRAVVLDRSMHYVVANIVLPLTKPQQVSFVTLWGGRTVMNFVSHSWGTVHSAFVNTIRCHAKCQPGDNWRSQTYWICSFSNNQWDISTALGDTVMESAFARVLTGGLNPNVVMVLDADVQPLHRVWCLFELLVSHDQNLKVQYATAVGIIGDRRCTSVDIPLAIARRVKSLKVAECEASDAGDKRKILEAITERLGSLEAMDRHIGALMASSLEAAFSYSQDEVGQTVRELQGCELEGKAVGVPMTHPLSREAPGTPDPIAP